MIDGFTEAQLIGGLIAVLIASYAAFFAWIVASINGLRREMHDEINGLRQELLGEIHQVRNKLDMLTVAVSRLEGAVYHGLPEPRRASQE